MEGQIVGVPVEVAGVASRLKGGQGAFDRQKHAGLQGREGAHRFRGDRDAQPSAGKVLAFIGNPAVLQGKRQGILAGLRRSDPPLYGGLIIRPLGKNRIGRVGTGIKEGQEEDGQDKKGKERAAKETAAKETAAKKQRRLADRRRNKDKISCYVTLLWFI